MKQIQAKTRQFQAKLDLFFILISFGVKITSDTCDIGPNYLLDKDLIVWGHHIRSSINSESSETRRVVLKYSRSNKYLPKISTK